MKKLLLVSSLCALSSLAFAKETINVPTPIIEEPSIVQSKTIIEKVPQYNIYGKIGVNIWSEYDSITLTHEDISSGKISDGESDSIGFEVALETTKNITNNFEFGLGIAYQRHSDLKSHSYSIDDKDYDYDNYTYDMDRYDSLPIYFVGKYNFDKLNNGLKPYLKANFGYSFNFDKGELALFNEYSVGGNVYTEDDDRADMDIKNGMYLAIGGGVEYNNLFVDLMYQMTTAEVNFKNSEYGINSKKDIDYSRVTLGFGYKFTY